MTQITQSKTNASLKNVKLRQNNVNTRKKKLESKKPQDDHHDSVHPIIIGVFPCEVPKTA